MFTLIQDGPPAADEGSDSDRDENEAKCMIVYKNKVFKWYLETDDGTIDDNEVSFQDFCDFLEDDVGVPNIDIDDMNDEVEIFLIDDKDDIDNDSQQILCADDFGDVFEDFNPDSDPRQVFYFVVKVELIYMSIAWPVWQSYFLFCCLFCVAVVVAVAVAVAVVVAVAVAVAVVVCLVFFRWVVRYNLMMMKNRVTTRMRMRR